MSEAPAFDLVRMEYGDHPVVFVYGEIDLMTAPKLHEALKGLLAEQPPLVLLDLANVSFIDSTGLSVLLVAHRHTQDYGGDLRLVSVPATVARVLEHTGLNERFRLYGDLDAAAKEPLPAPDDR